MKSINETKKTILKKIKKTNEKTDVKTKKSNDKTNEKTVVKSKKSNVKPKKSSEKSEKSNVKSEKTNDKIRISKKSDVKPKKTSEKSKKSDVKPKKSDVKPKKSDVKPKKTNDKSEKSSDKLRKPKKSNDKSEKSSDKIRISEKTNDKIRISKKSDVKSDVKNKNTFQRKKSFKLFGGIGGISAQVKQRVSGKNHHIARFYDDSPDNIYDVEKEGLIQCIIVPRTTKLGPRGEEDGGHRLEYINYIREKGGWDLERDDRDLERVLRFFENESDYSEEAVSDSLQEKDMLELREWFLTNPQAKCVIFDFDRVINRVEGIIGVDTNKELKQLGISASGLAKYHMGTKERMRVFRRLINELIRLNKKVCIVTNNTATDCETFYLILKEIHPYFTEENVFGSWKYPTKLHCIRDKKII
jgi:hypothetical protein